MNKSINFALLLLSSLTVLNADDAEQAKKAMSAFSYPETMKMSVFAHGGQLDSPVAFSIDEKTGDVYVAESPRFQKGGVDDARRFRYRLLDDLASQTTADRLAMYKKWSAKKSLSEYTQIADRVRLLKDTDQDGSVDESIIFAEFRGALDGAAAGILAFDESIYLTCIPKLWKMKNKNDAVTEMKSMFEGFGVHGGISGHDLHGLTLGPDGRIYFTQGDRGYSVKSKEGKRLEGLGQGAVFRCWPDGTGLEVYFKGLRNPQELAFDQYGNLFTVDNNQDAGDEARLCYLLEGGDAGWRMGHQVLSTFKHDVAYPNAYNSWMVEAMWDMGNELSPQWILPPIAHLNRGPSGLFFYDGDGLGAENKNIFISCNYRGSAASTLETFSVEPEGGSYKLKSHNPIWVKGIAASDVEVGLDGKLYILDFGGGWQGHEGGNIYKLELGQQAAINSAMN